MVKSKAKEVTPHGTIHLVKWVRKQTTRGVKGQWVTEKRTNSRQSVQSSPTKSPIKQPADMSPTKSLHEFSGDFEGGYEDQSGINPMRLPQGLRKKWKKMAKSKRISSAVEIEDIDVLCSPSIQTHVSSSTGCSRPTLVICILPLPVVVGARSPSMAEVNLDPYLGQGAPFEEISIPLTDPVEQEEGMLHLAALGAEDWLRDAVMAFMRAIPVAQTAHAVGRFCQCPDARTQDKQMFEMGMFPASFTRPKTAFTFALLNDFILDNLECGTSAMNYYSKLRCITSSVFPHLVPDRYRELMRVARQWRQLKLLKWNGFSHNRGDPKDSELALFCPACPQPGINVILPTEYDDARPGWLYARSLVMDGNFKAEHLHPVHPEDEVWLTDGKCFMVGRAQYQAHLALTRDLAECSECNNHRAVNQANASRHKLEATGIGGCACARHGCFVPNSMVDFQKGKRQMNMDYALCNALHHNTDGLAWALTFYNVNCQYSKHLRRWVDESFHLTIPSGMDIIPGIGLWPVHGHQDKCFVRYASNFIEGAARIDGEIMETLWAPLNMISPSAWGMSTPHQQECLDYQMNDCNFMKMIRMGV
ncbi:hypothetical protein EV702DRAFT_1050657 [Suillus placidus]|uniref:CxC2-like cysteine cluster KDZ transposase-associated domain-containing protein n=1 Tax=Suillus placidus TaxID=48579 RepID=A0A9P6ZHF1_9AGAM|nr:hypothetical protein EV702DRAFT_1050657 [Suillus placidus]